MSSDQIKQSDADDKRSRATELLSHEIGADSIAAASRVSDVNEPVSGSQQGQTRREFSRRALIRAGWAVPVILAVGLPQRVGAMSPVLHNDGGHDDGVEQTHSDVKEEHNDTFPPPPGVEHEDISVPHSDELFPPHQDFHHDFPPPNA
jgi:hypothetical protein